MMFKAGPEVGKRRKLVVVLAAIAVTLLVVGFALDHEDVSVAKNVAVEQQGEIEIVPDDGSVSTAASSQLIQQLAGSLFHGKPDPHRQKFILTGNGPPHSANWGTKPAADNGIRQFGNVQPDYSNAFYIPTATTLPHAYQQCIGQLRVKNAESNPQLMAALTKQSNTNAKLDAQLAIANSDFQQWLENFKEMNPGQQVPYLTYKKYIADMKPGLDREIKAANGNSDAAEKYVNDIRKSLATSDPVVQMQTDFHDWMKKTDGGTKGRESVWGTSTDVSGLLAGWLTGASLTGSTIQFNQASQSYASNVVSQKGGAIVSVLWATAAFGRTSSGSSVFHSGSQYSISISWESATAITLTAPSVYNFARVKAVGNDKSQLIDQYKGTFPLTGHEGAVITCLPTQLILMFGLKMTATFDQSTFSKMESSVKQGGVVSLGFFAIGGGSSSQSKSSYHFNKQSLTLTAEQTGTAKVPFLAGMTCDPL